jgi:regulator of sirC expression with transglutaminase-like and TPR domain
VRDPFARDPQFHRLIHGEERVDLVLVCLEIARDAYPDLEFDGILHQIEALADRVRARCAPGANARSILGQINWVLFVEEGFQGNTHDYYDPDNSYLNAVLDRKLGLPITLSILYQRLASRVGLELGFANLPMHFALTVPGLEAPWFVDPFHEGRILDLPACERFLTELAGREIRLDPSTVESCPLSRVVARMLRNLKAIYLERRDFASALPVVRRMAALLRDEPLEQRDWGMVSLQVDRPGEALAPLQKYLEVSPDAPDASAIRALLKTARRDVASRN